jgi:transcriptional regulator with XRE-family HTH domain
MMLEIRPLSSSSEIKKYNVSFGKVLRALRRERHLTQETLAFDSGLDRTYVSVLELGTSSPSLNTIVALCFALDLSLGSLANRIDAMVAGEEA